MTGEAGSCGRGRKYALRSTVDQDNPIKGSTSRGVSNRARSGRIVKEAPIASDEAAFGPAREKRPEVAHRCIRNWEGDEPDSPNRHWLPTDHGQGLAISGDAVRLQADIGTLAVYVATKWRKLSKLGAAAEEDRRRRFLDRLHACFEAEPLEDGMDHPAEQVIAVALDAEAREAVLGRIRGICLDPRSPAFSAAVFLCLARQPGVGSATWRVELVRNGLAADDVELRDAAVQAAEIWGDPGFRQVLEAHSEPVPWLDEYVRGVIDDLAG